MALMQWPPPSEDDLAENQRQWEEHMNETMSVPMTRTTTAENGEPVMETVTFNISRKDIISMLRFSREIDTQ